MFNDKTPNLKAPRFRRTVEDSASPENLQGIKDNINTTKNYPLKDIRIIIKTFNEAIWDNVINHRDGVTLPEQLGDIFVGTCPPKKMTKNVDFKSTQKYNEVVQHRNFESDRYLAKIFYSIYNTKRRYKNGDVWGFKAVRNFSRSVSKSYPKMWKIYHQIEPGKKIADIYRSFKVREYEKEVSEKLILSYNEFEF